MKFFIQEVTVKGFKSFKDEQKVKDINPAYNVLVGKSGTGKSNFFDAIMMVLEPSQSLLKPKDRALERRRLLYDQNVSGSIKVVFNDREGRLHGYLVAKGKIAERARPMRSISVERVIDSKLDIFLVNGKKMQSKDVAEMFKMAGLPPLSSQFYLKQDTINHVAINAYSGILQQLLAFTRVKQSEEGAERFNSELEASSRAMDSLLEHIRERLARAENESEQLERNRYLTQKEAALRYLIIKNEFEDRSERLKKIENEMRALKTVDLVQSRIKLGEDRARVQKALHHCADAKIELDGVKEELNNLNSSLLPLIQHQSGLKFKVTRLIDKISFDKLRKVEATNNLEELKETIRKTKEKLETAKASVESFEQEKYDCLMELTTKLQKMKHFIDKQRRLKDFLTKEERDRAITAELMSVDRKMSLLQEEASELGESLRILEEAESLGVLSSNISGELDKMLRLQQNIVQTSKECFALKEKWDAQRWKTMELKEKTDNLLRKETLLKLEIIKADRNLFSSFSPNAAKELSKGLRSVTKVLELFKSEGGQNAELAEKSYHGIVIDNFDCAWELDQAVELSAGVRLFDHIVDSEEVSRKILSEIERQKLPGKVNFIFLKTVPKITRFQRLETDVAAVFSHLEFDPKYRNVMLGVFGRTLLCPTAACASRQATSSGLNCVTLEGHLISPNGSETLRPVEVFSCREIRRNQESLTEKIKSLSIEREGLKADLSTEERKAAEIQAEMCKMNEKLEYNRETYNELKRHYADRMAEARQTLICVEDKVAIRKLKLVNCKRDLAAMQTMKELLEAELLQDLAELSEEEQKQRDTLEDEVFALHQQKKRLSVDGCHFESNKRLVEETLQQLARQDDRVSMDILGILVEQEEEFLKQMNCDFDAITLKIQEIENAIQEVKMNRLSTCEALRTLQQEKEHYLALMKESQREVEKVANDLSAKTEDRYALKEKVKKNGQRLSVLKSTADSRLVNKYSQLSLQTMYYKVGKVVHKTKDIDQINLDGSIEIEHYRTMISHIEEEYETNLNHGTLCLNFREDSRNYIFKEAFLKLRESFALIFGELVPGGRGKLALIDSAGEQWRSADRLDYTKIVGVDVQVTFDQNDELRGIGELSRGQISLVSLALIFALNRVVPSPIILLDEVDQALSVQSALTLAAFLNKQKSQIILSTYKSEMATIADTFFRFKLRYLMTFVKTVSRSSALDFLEHRDDPDSEEE